jgi:succinoglycan biosynthesis protein ExoA
LSGSLALEYWKEAREEGSRGACPPHPRGGCPRGQALVSVIVPVRPAGPDPRAICLLERAPPALLEVIVAEGECPSRQRNLAAQEATGDILLFLDDDSECSPRLIESYAGLFREDPKLAAVGGPTVYRGRGLRERVAAGVLADPMVSGRSASRYAPRGHKRTSDERELILSNLAVRRSAFEALGGFEESLYPNEENLLLDCVRERGGKVVYDPSAIATRPAPKAGWELIAKVFGYGRGRASQLRRYPSWVGLARVAGVIAFLVGFCIAPALLPWTVLPLLGDSALAATYYGVLGFRTSRSEGLLVGTTSAIVALTVHIAYAVGVTIGLARRLPARRDEVRVRHHKTRRF